MELRDCKLRTADVSEFTGLELLDLSNNDLVSVGGLETVKRYSCL